MQGGGGGRGLFFALFSLFLRGRGFLFEGCGRVFLWVGERRGLGRK